jgi:hypothetical protein
VFLLSFKYLTLNKSIHRPVSNQANLVCDGPILQGPQAHLTSITREVALVTSHLLRAYVGDLPGYIQDVDYNQIIAAIKLKHQDGKTTQVIRPIPWPNAPKPDGSTAEFKMKLEGCQKYLHHFAMHTPEYFLAFNKHKQSTNRGKQPASKKRRQNKGKQLDESDITTEEDGDIRGEGGDEDDCRDDEGEDGDEDEDEDEDEGFTDEQSVNGSEGEGGDDGQWEVRHTCLSTTLTLLC